MGYRTLHYEEIDHAGVITLNRPEKRNAINGTLVEELGECIHHCGTENNVKSIILTGSGKCFCSGGEVMERTPSEMKSGLANIHTVFLEIHRIPKPVIAAVNGPAVGAGFALALVCDIVIAAGSASFNPRYIEVGVSPDCGLSYTLPRLIGNKRAAWLLFTGESVDAHRGYEMGFVNQVSADDQLMNAAHSLAMRLSRSATLAIAKTKELIGLSWNHSLETQMECERQSIGLLSLTADNAEAITAFQQKRAPEFKGH